MSRIGQSSVGAILWGSLGAVCAAALLLTLFVAPAAHAQGQPMLTRHIHQAFEKALANGQSMLLDKLDAKRPMKLNIALPLRNEAELEDLLQRLYDPNSADFHQFLSVAEFTERFGPTQDDYDTVLRFAKANGLNVTGTAPNRVLVNVTGSVANVERAFHVNLGVYQHPTENRKFFAPDREPSADLPVPAVARDRPRQLLDPASGQPLAGEGLPAQHDGLGPRRSLHRQRLPEGVLRRHGSHRLGPVGRLAGIPRLQHR